MERQPKIPNWNPKVVLDGAPYPLKYIYKGFLQREG